MSERIELVFQERRLPSPTLLR